MEKKLSPIRVTLTESTAQYLLSLHPKVSKAIERLVLAEKMRAIDGDRLPERIAKLERLSNALEGTATAVRDIRRLAEELKTV